MELKTDEEVLKALLFLYSKQLPQEQDSKTTGYENHEGFNKTDAYFLSKMAELTLNGKGLSEKQMLVVKTQIRKYHRQIRASASYVEKITLPAITPRNQVKKDPVVDYDESSNRIAVHFPVFNYPWYLKIKVLPGRRWDSDKKTWFLPFAKEILDVFEGLEFSVGLKKAIARTDSAQIPTSADGGSSTTGKIQGFKIEPFPFQIEGIAFLEQKGGRGIIGDDMGCIDGKALISVNRCGKGFTLPIEKAYAEFHGLSGKGDNWDSTFPTYTRSLCGKEIRLNRIRNIIAKGVRKVVKLTLASGKTLRLTTDHEVACSVKVWSKLSTVWTQASELKSGDKVLTNGTNGAFGGAFGHPLKDTVVSVVPDGTAHVYDIVMADPHRNFVVNKIVVHNCGKTIQALGYLQAHKEFRPALVVCPASLKLNWAKEAKKCMTNPRVVILSGTKAPEDVNGECGPYRESSCPGIQTKSKTANPKNAIHIINYDILENWLPYLKSLDLKCMILDETIYIKNRKTKRTKAVQELRRVPSIIGLSGRPIENRPEEFWPVLNLVRKEMFPSFWNYARKFCNLTHNGFGWVTNGSSNAHELNDILRKYVMIRRTKDEVLTELPPKMRSVIPVEMDQRSEGDYREAERDFIAWLRKVDPMKASNAERAEALTKINGLMNLCMKAKIESSLKWINDYLESENKLVLFAVHHHMIDSMKEALKERNPVVVDGRVSVQKRQDAVDRFQNDSGVHAFIGQIRAAGVGLTLTASRATCFLELGWTPGEHDQAEDRVHRIGQTDSVTAYYLILEDTIEEWMMDLIDSKRAIITSVLDGKEVSDDSMLISLLKKVQTEKCGKGEKKNVSKSRRG